MASVADIVSGSLAAQGIRHAFRVPGGELLTLSDALAAVWIRVRRGTFTVIICEIEAGSYVGRI
jgi:thiamine pyrophosphate-dependent acetolactate synthase large subunit-like protein